MLLNQTNLVDFETEKQMKTNYFYQVLLALSASSLLSSCDALTKEIEVVLPPYESELVVECYLEVGKPYRLALTQTERFLTLDPNSLLNNIITSATVVVSHSGIKDTLRFAPQQDPESKKLFNFASTSLVPADYNSTFDLYIKDSKNRTLVGQTKLMRKVDLSRLEWRFRPDTALALAFSKIYDQPVEKNYYRLIINDSTDYRRNQSKTPPRDGFANQDFLVTDDFSTNDTVRVGGPFQFPKGDTVHIWFYHLTLQHFNYTTSVQNAISSNGNPFGQPSPIKSNVKGGLGIFTGIAFDKQIRIVQ